MGIWPPTPGRPHRLGPSRAGINCCADKDNPALNVSIGYFTDEINAGDTLGLTVEQADPSCGGYFYVWAITDGPGELSSESGLDVIYTAPATGHGCPGDATITLSCGGAVMDTLIVKINYDYAIEFNYGDPELEIDRNDSLAVSVTATGTPLTWSVSGVGFSLEHGETEGETNTLHADGTACGAATITIEDCDGNVATGYVRCMEGQWVDKGTLPCQMPGVIGVATPVGSTGSFIVTKIEGNKKQIVDYDKLGYGSGYAEGPTQAAACNAILEAKCSDPAVCLDFTPICNVVGQGGRTENCGKNDSICRVPDCSYSCQEYDNGDCILWKATIYTQEYYTPAGSDLHYYEWEC